MPATGPDREASRPTTSVFPSVLVGIDGSRTSVLAVEQAAALGPAAGIRLLAVTWQQGTGASAVAVLSPWRAEAALERARQHLLELGITPSVEMVEDPDATGRLLREAQGHDLLVLGAHGHSRAGGMLTGSTASAALHRAEIPVLLARTIGTPEQLLDRVLLALDGTEASLGAARIVAALARRRGVGDVTLIAPSDPDATRRHVIATCAAEVRAATGLEPVVLDEHGAAHHAITRAAKDSGATLIVVGSRGLSGTAALRSVSERVGHDALCSVLVVRGRPVWP